MTLYRCLSRHYSSLDFDFVVSICKISFVFCFSFFNKLPSRWWCNPMVGRYSYSNRIKTFEKSRNFKIFLNFLFMMTSMWVDRYLYNNDKGFRGTRTWGTALWLRLCCLQKTIVWSLLKFRNIWFSPNRSLLFRDYFTVDSNWCFDFILSLIV